MEGVGNAIKKKEEKEKRKMHTPFLRFSESIFFNSLCSDKMELIKRRQGKSWCQTTSERKHSRKACTSSCQKQE
jgi:hypothetical protein